MITLQRQFGDKGLHIIAVERQLTPHDEIKQILTEHKVNYPVAEGQIDGYDDPGKLPYAWIIGVDGKIVWAGDPARSGRNEVTVKLNEALKQVKWPGLGAVSLDISLLKAGEAWNAGELGLCRKEARSVADGEKFSALAKKDAAHVLSKVEARLQKMHDEMKSLKDERRYNRVIEMYERMAVAFKGFDEEKEARAAIKQLRDDKDVKTELKAFEDLARLRERLKDADERTRDGALDKFAEKNKGTRAADDALAVRSIGAPTKEPEGKDPKEKTPPEEEKKE